LDFDIIPKPNKIKMKFKSIILLCLVVLNSFVVNAQTYSILIKGGTVIDPRNNLNEVMDVGIFEGKVKKVAKNIDAKEAKQVVNAKGMYVTPGLIDIHGHVFFGTQPDHYLSNGLWLCRPTASLFVLGSRPSWMLEARDGNLFLSLKRM